MIIKSEKIKAYQRAVDLLLPAKEMPFDRSMQIDCVPTDSYADLVQAADWLSTNDYTFIVAGDLDCLEVYKIRLIPEPKKSEYEVDFDLSLCIDSVKRICVDYIDSSVELASRYSQCDVSDIKSQSVVMYSYLQRRTTSIACFRNYKNGSTNALKESIKELIQLNYLTDVTKSIITKEAGGRMFKILKGIE